MTVPKLLVISLFDRPQYLPDVFPKTQKTKLNEKQFSLNEMITRAVKFFLFVHILYHIQKCQIVLSFYKYILLYSI
jgi:hypothetical protein